MAQVPQQGYPEFLSMICCFIDMLEIGGYLDPLGNDISFSVIAP